MTIAEKQKEYRDKLTPVFGDREAKAITKLVLETILDIGRAQYAFDRFRIITEQQAAQLDNILARLLTHEPPQYILGEAWFYGLRFVVNDSVLIPRPETEELVELVIDECKLQGKANGNILDIGTGSGCIAIAIAKHLPQAMLSAVDVSPGALQTAAENCRLNNTTVQLQQLDMLNQDLPIGAYDVIVSNPPYIGHDEKSAMAANVLNFEPHLALFAPYEDALLFYRTIARKSIAALKPGGLLFFELNAAKGVAVEKMLCDLGYTNVELKTDLSGKARMIKAEAVI
ncbi:MAG TPA: peptide chain release factor N(5)-glutamine methyltransferase [Chitinophagales bacterium]|nr:peptide chain release factor N(5)-glutamine methyltransferase [Chitinophagales bacterium]